MSYDTFHKSSYILFSQTYIFYLHILYKGRKIANISWKIIYQSTIMDVFILVIRSHMFLLDIIFIEFLILVRDLKKL